ncbi:putative mucin-associated surface protein (MASP) [Trypanosoma cruzi Dm28c]|uniref:Putative mucin-associated surface protein (MASP) n=1 Tax=Trypanosoma cruzi Dm28c TaxID=1416333 RepID=V5ARS4_TRYCR|nr:putative mucin-associated surface protein (MASP) [Trypanosoma cruzi Dm28c]
MHDTHTTFCVDAFFCVLVHAHWSHLVQPFVFRVFTVLLFCCLFTVFSFNCFLFVFLAVQLLRGCVCFLPFCPFTDSNCFRVCALGCCHLSLCGVAAVSLLFFRSALTCC